MKVPFLSLVRDQKKACPPITKIYYDNPFLSTFQVSKTIYYTYCLVARKSVNYPVVWKGPWNLPRCQSYEESCLGENSPKEEIWKWRPFCWHFCCWSLTQNGLYKHTSCKHPGHSQRLVSLFKNLIILTIFIQFFNH